MKKILINESQIRSLIADPRLDEGNKTQLAGFLTGALAASGIAASFSDEGPYISFAYNRQPVVIKQINNVPNVIINRNTKIPLGDVIDQNKSDQDYKFDSGATMSINDGYVTITLPDGDTIGGEIAQPDYLQTLDQILSPNYYGIQESSIRQIVKRILHDSL